MPEKKQPSSLEEKRRHGTAAFPCAFYLADSSQRPPGFPFLVKHHWHEAPEILYFERGLYRMEINMQARILEGPCFCFINSGELHHLTSLSEEYQEQAFVFSPAIVSFDFPDLAQEQFLRPLGGHRLALPGFLPREHPAFGELQREFLNIRSAFYRENPDFPEQLTVKTAPSQLRIKAALLNILSILGEHRLLVSTEPVQNQRVESLKKVITYIQENYQSKLYISELAGLANMNEQYFCRFFKKALGKTPVSYINDYRIRRAISLLRNTELPVTDVCLECGFNNLGHFMKEFKKATGLTPLQFRKKAGGTGEAPGPYETSSHSSDAVQSKETGYL